MVDADLNLYAQWSGAVTFTWDTTGQLSKSIQVKTNAATAQKLKNCFIFSTSLN